MKASNDNNYFVELSKINVNEHVERKGQFSYLSWPFAVSQLRQFDPVATWQVLRFDGLPYLNTEAGCFVEVAVCVRGVSLSQIHPVLDSKNRPILAPTAFDINTSIQRCLVKAIALHGLGLYLYSGEDLPLASDEPKAEDKPVVPVAAPAPAPAPAPATPIRQGKLITIAQIAQIERLLTETGSDRAKLLAYFGVETLAEIAVTDYPRVVRSLEKRRAA
ncbi:MAG: DUF1071 domain-containing protein [Actinomycetes bacterium]